MTPRKKPTKKKCLTLTEIYSGWSELKIYKTLDGKMAMTFTMEDDKILEKEKKK